MSLYSLIERLKGQNVSVYSLSTNIENTSGVGIKINNCNSIYACENCISIVGDIENSIEIDLLHFINIEEYPEEKQYIINTDGIQFIISY